MKKTLIISLSFACGLQILFSAFPAEAYRYRYGDPAKPAAQADYDLLNEITPTLEFPPQPLPDMTPSGAPVRIMAMPVAPVSKEKLNPLEAAAADVAPWLAKKKLAKPFFTAPVKTEKPVVAVPQIAASKPVEKPAPVPAVKVSPVETAPVASIPAAPEPAAAPIPPAEPVPLEEPVVPAETNAAVPSSADLTLGFDTTSSTLSPQAQEKLNALSVQLQDMGEMRIQIRAYATGEDGTASSARRMALSRALAVRGYLIDKGIKATRLDVRALGSETNTTPLDRVDLVFAR